MIREAARKYAYVIYSYVFAQKLSFSFQLKNHVGLALLSYVYLKSTVLSEKVARVKLVIAKLGGSYSPLPPTPYAYTHNCLLFFPMQTKRKRRKH